MTTKETVYKQQQILFFVATKIECIKERNQYRWFQFKKRKEVQIRIDEAERKIQFWLKVDGILGLQ